METRDNVCEKNSLSLTGTSKWCRKLRGGSTDNSPKTFYWFKARAQEGNTKGNTAHVLPCWLLLGLLDGTAGNQEQLGSSKATSGNVQEIR